jgi:hypothetical protein
VLREFLNPRHWAPSANREFAFNFDQICQLCDQADEIFKKEPSVLRLRGGCLLWPFGWNCRQRAQHTASAAGTLAALVLVEQAGSCSPVSSRQPRPPPAAPIKIFGDLHGQFGDLMRLFEEYGTPSTAGDITYIDYLFLGDFVDRGAHSLETICLLLALKIEHPRSVHLIRGNHEAADINALFGFRLECLERLGDAQGLQAWQRLNGLFNWLPLAALIEDKVLCMHGGIGRSINSIEQIEELQRPLTMEDGGIVLMDLLWSDPTTNDAVEGVQPSPRGPGLVTFGPDRVMEFCRVGGGCSPGPLVVVVWGCGGGCDWPALPVHCCGHREQTQPHPCPSCRTTACR